ncbi:cell surface protein [Stieleria sp. TO1_6]|uniref:cell surface protein n=1 Tax=Stieleria tagensis TaxID=2956795 RepID=UPI00209B961D|nr:cell surface protein [Stieleria tagensis]MCO8123852.1 cell surface protein [Stieleria tagensis]
MSDQAQASAPQPSQAKTKTQAQTRDTSKMRKYLDDAMQVLKKFGVDSKNSAPQELITLLESVKHVDEAKVLAIADVIQHMGAFNALVRENVESIQIGNRYMQITQEFDSVREDSKRLISQLDDGKISGTEKISNWWMKMRRGTPNDRFEKIIEIYGDVAKDTKEALKSEELIMDAYIDFRFALKEAEILSRELLDEHAPTLDAARQGLATAQEALDNYTGTDEGGKSQLELARDESRHTYEQEDETYQLLKDIAENLQIGYDVGETLITKLKQTHDVKERVFRRAVTFFTTNEHVFTILGTVYQSQHGLHEVTQATEAMKDGVNKGLEDVANLGRELERAALKAGYGSTIDPESVQKLVDAISGFQIESLELITELRKESEESTKAIRKSVEEGKKKYQETLARHARRELG